MNLPEAKYVKAPDGAWIAYYVLGEAPLDLVWMTGFVGDWEIVWEHPLVPDFFGRLATFSRLILHDRRGTGASDREPGPPDLETQADDLRAVLDAAGSERPTIAASGQAGASAALFAATSPDRIAALVLYLAYARYAWAEDYEWGLPREWLERRIKASESGWGTEDYARSFLANDSPSLASDPASVRWLARVHRQWLSRSQVRDLFERFYDTDVRDILPTIQAPTLVIGREANSYAEEDTYLASLIRGSKQLRLPGSDAFPWLNDCDLVEPIRSFLGLEPVDPINERVLATVLFTDIVASTAHAARVGDRGWKELLESHHELVRAELTRFRGREIDTAGDGFFASFDGPARAVRCAQAITMAVRPLGVEVRAGIHTGEVETIDGKVGGLAVVIGSRVGSLAGPSEVLVSSTVRDLTAGSGLAFDDRGEHELKGLPDRWRLYGVMQA